MAPKRKRPATEDANLSFRITSKLKEELQVAARRRGIETSEEARQRLALSFANDKALAELFGERHNRDLLALIRMVMFGISTYTNLSCWDATYTYEATIAGIDALLEGLRGALGKAQSAIEVPKAVQEEQRRERERLAALPRDSDRARRLPPPDRLADPRELGRSIAHGLLTQLQLTPAAEPIDNKTGVQFSSTWLELSVIKRSLGDSK
jgi:hypothetical protein